MGDHHVPVGPGLLVEGGPGLDAEGLGHVDLDVVDVLAVPDRLEQPVGEAEGQDVLGRLLAQEVVDPEDLVVVEDLAHQRVQLTGAVEVGPERLLHDDPGPVGEPGLPEGPHHGVGGVGRDAQVVEAPGLGVEGGLEGPDRLGQPVHAVVPGHVADAPRELVPVLVGDAAPGELVAGRPGDAVVLPLVERLERGGHDVAVGQHAGPRQVEQAGQELPLGQVAGGAEQDDDVRAWRVRDPGGRAAPRRRAPRRRAGPGGGVVGTALRVPVRRRPWLGPSPSRTAGRVGPGGAGRARPGPVPSGRGRTATCTSWGRPYAAFVSGGLRACVHRVNGRPARRGPVGSLSAAPPPGRAPRPGRAHLVGEGHRHQQDVPGDALPGLGHEEEVADHLAAGPDGQVDAPVGQAQVLGVPDDGPHLDLAVGPQPGGQAAVARGEGARAQVQQCAGARPPPVGPRPRARRRRRPAR